MLFMFRNVKLLWNWRFWWIFELLLLNVELSSPYFHFLSPEKVLISKKIYFWPSKNFFHPQHFFYPQIFFLYSEFFFMLKIFLSSAFFFFILKMFSSSLNVDNFWSFLIHKFFHPWIVGRWAFVPLKIFSRCFYVFLWS